MLATALRRALPLAAFIAILGAGLAAPVIGEDASSSSAAVSSSGAAPAAPAVSDADLLAQGKHIWSDAACYNCHGATGGGGHSADFPPGPSLRTSGLDPQSMLQIVECGLPNTKMPAWLKGAYTEIACYGNPLGQGGNEVLLSGAYGEDDLKALVDYVQTNFMKQPMPNWTAAQ
jgi:mono/diheme cytochrome c family protein